MKTKFLLLISVVLLSACIKDDSLQVVQRKVIHVVRDYDDEPISNATVYFLKSETMSWDNANADVVGSFETNDQGSLLTPELQWSSLVVEKPGFVRTSLGQYDYNSLINQSPDQKVRIQQKVIINVELENDSGQDDFSTIHVYPEVILSSGTSLNFIHALSQNTSRSADFVSVASNGMRFKIVYDQDRPTETIVYETHPILPEGENHFKFTY